MRKLYFLLIFCSVFIQSYAQTSTGGDYVTEKKAGVGVNGQQSTVNYSKYTPNGNGGSTQNVTQTPSNQVTNFSDVYITLNWTDATGENLPAGYLIVYSSESFEALPVPTDGTAPSTYTQARAVKYGKGTCTFGNLLPNTTYYFKIYSFNGSGVTSAYKTDGNIPQLEKKTGNGSATNQAGAVDNGNMLLGNPSNAVADVAQPNNYLFDAEYYIESYNNERGTPNWVSWHLQNTDMGSQSRTDNFRTNTELPSSFYKVTNSYDFGTTGFNRGHNCPSADRTSSYDANNSTFLMSNMIPQSSENNGGTWGHMESALRDSVREKGYEIYIIMGVYGKGGESDMGVFETIQGGHVAVPTNVWKVAVMLPKGDNDIKRIESGEAHVIAVDTPNNTTIKSDWTQYITSASSIEAAMSEALGVDFKFFTNVNVTTRQQLLDQTSN